MPTIDMLHISDTHGSFPKLLDGPDIIVHSGDFMPNMYCERVMDQHFQKNWIHTHRDQLREWIGDRLFLITTGNHDYYNPSPDMINAGIDARCLNNTWFSLPSISFYGFPYVPQCSFNRTWAGELDEPRMGDAIADIDWNDDDEPQIQIPDVFVPHCPIWGVLDTAHGQHLGSLPMRHWFERMNRRPKAVLHGHIHEANGETEWMGMKISNAATTQRIVTIEV